MDLNGVNGAQFLTAETVNAVLPQNDRCFLLSLVLNLNRVPWAGIGAYAASDAPLSINYRRGTEKLCQLSAEQMWQLL